eukprot:symbB.v1.2.038539.t1/scaffold6034.1/size21572/1
MSAAVAVNLARAKTGILGWAKKVGQTEVFDLAKGWCHRIRERSASELNSFIACQPQLLQHCRQLWKAKAKPCDEKDRMRNASTGTEVEGRQSVDSEGDYASKIVSLKKAADRISCANGEARQAKKR